MNRWTCKICRHAWASDSPAAYWCPSCGVPRVYPRPLFVALEGVDASGKALQSERLAKRLGATRFDFPDYKTPIGELIGQHLRGEWGAHRVDSKHPEEALIFQALQSANRLEAAHSISLELAEGRAVVADRYTMSGVAYGMADGIDQGYLERLHAHLPQPSHWVLLDVDVETSLERRPERRDRYERDLDYLRRVCLAYRQIWIYNRWPIVDGRGSVDDVAGQIAKAVDLCPE